MEQNNYSSELVTIKTLKQSICNCKIYHLDTVKSQNVQIKKFFMSLYYECLAIKNVSGFIGGNKTQFAWCCKILKIKCHYVFVSFFTRQKSSNNSVSRWSI